MSGGGDRNSYVEKGRVKRLRLSSAGSDTAAKCGCYLGSRGEGFCALPAWIGVDQGTSAAAHDHNSAAGIARVAVRNGRDGLESVSRGDAHCVLRKGPECRGVALDLCLEVTARRVRVLDTQWHFECRKHDDNEPEIPEQKASGHVRKRKPTPRTVSIQSGSPSLRRSAAT